MSQLRSLFLLLIIPILTVLSSLVAIFTPLFSKSFQDRLIKFWARTILFISGVKLNITGLDNLNGVKSVIFVSNHLSLFDIPVLYASLPLSFRMAAKAELFKIPFFGRALASLGFFPIKRESPENARSSFQKMERNFQTGQSLWIAPEGTRQTKFQLGPFKMGAFYLAIKFNRPIVPVIICGTQAVLPKKSLFVNWRHWRESVTVEIGQPISVESWPWPVRHELRDHVRDKMEKVFFRLAQR